MNNKQLKSIVFIVSGLMGGNILSGNFYKDGLTVKSNRQEHEKKEKRQQKHGVTILKKNKMLV